MKNMKSIKYLGDNKKMLPNGDVSIFTWKDSVFRAIHYTNKTTKWFGVLGKRSPAYNYDPNSSDIGVIIYRKDGRPFISSDSGGGVVRVEMCLYGIKTEETWLCVNEPELYDELEYCFKGLRGLFEDGMSILKGFKHV